jgi:tRNA A37 methylthiotransferase MiaB
VGFCGETEAEFQNTMHAFREIAFDQAFMFAYSPRR